MSCYGPLAAWYDQLTGDVPYEEFADYYEAEFARDGGQFRLLLDFCCGTGTLTCMLSQRGYEMIGVDASVDMLMQAREKAAEQGQSILFLCQDASELDLYGTVDAAVFSRRDGSCGGWEAVVSACGCGYRGAFRGGGTGCFRCKRCAIWHNRADIPRK